MLQRKSAVPLGTGNEVLVSFDRDGELHNETINSVETVRSYRALDKERRQHAATLAERRSQAHGERERAIQKAHDDFQTALDGIEDDRNAKEQAFEQQRRQIDEQAFKLAEEAIAKRDQAEATNPAP